MARGGKREGAGRPPVAGDERGRQIKVILTPEQEQAIDALAARLGGERKKAAAIRRALSVGIAALKATGEIPEETSKD